MNLNEQIGAAIQRAAGELPDGYEITIEIERGAGTVVLWVIDEEGGLRRANDSCGDDLSLNINNAVDMAIEHNKTHNANSAS